MDRLKTIASSLVLMLAFLGLPHPLAAQPLSQVFSTQSGSQPFHTLLIFAPSRTHPLLIEQKSLFQEHPSLAAIQIASIVEIIGSEETHITGEPALESKHVNPDNLREKYNIDRNAFTLVWLNDQGDMVLKRNQPLTRDELL